MKRSILGIFLIAALQLNAQSGLNGGFESWTTSGTYYVDTLPANWWSPMCNTVFRTTDALQGTYASRVQGYFACGIAPGMLINGTAPADGWSFIRSGTPFTAKPASISGNYKLEAPAGDSAEVTIILKRYNAAAMKQDTVGLGYRALAPSPAYHTYTVNITDMMPGVNPDSIIFIFNSSKHYLWDTVTYALPNLFLDALGVQEAKPSGTEEMLPELSIDAYPNPFTEQITFYIGGDRSGMKDVFLSIYDAAGRLCRSAGPLMEDQLIIERGDLPAGTYTYRMQAKGYAAAAGRLIIP